MPIHHILRHLTYNLGNATRMVYEERGDAEAYLLDELRNTENEYTIRLLMHPLLALMNESKGTPQHAYYSTLFKVLNSKLYDSPTVLSHLITTLPAVNRSAPSVVLPVAKTSSSSPPLSS